MYLLGSNFLYTVLSFTDEAMESMGEGNSDS